MRVFRFLVLLVVTVLVSGFSNLARADSYSHSIEVFKKSPVVQPFFENAYGYAIFPIVGKAGIVVGAAYGKGKVYRGERLTGTARLYKATIGFQLGGQVFSEIIFFEDKRVYDEFASGNFEFDAAASAVVITAAVQTKIGTQGVTGGASAGPATGIQGRTKYSRGMAVFVHIKGGLMFEAAIGGQKFSFLRHATEPERQEKAAHETHESTEAIEYEEGEAEEETHETEKGHD
jgi:lipid-binding SYLF domain-containing protein